MLRDIFREAARSRQTGHDDTIRRTVHAYLDSYEAGDIDARLALFAEDATFEDPVGTETISGRGGLKAFWAAGAQFKIRMDLEMISVNGSEAAILFVATLRDSQGDMVKLRVIETLVIDQQGRISRMRAYFDQESIS